MHTCCTLYMYLKQFSFLSLIIFYNTLVQWMFIPAKQFGTTCLPRTNVFSVLINDDRRSLHVLPKLAAYNTTRQKCKIIIIIITVDQRHNSLTRFHLILADRTHTLQSRNNKINSLHSANV